MSIKVNLIIDDFSVVVESPSTSFPRLILQYRRLMQSEVWLNRMSSRFATLETCLHYPHRYRFSAVSGPPICGMRGVLCIVEDWLRNRDRQCIVGLCIMRSVAGLHHPASVSFVTAGNPGPCMISIQIDDDHRSFTYWTW